jgi:hypothetical protein
LQVVLAAVDPNSGDFESAQLDPTIFKVPYHVSQLLHGSLRVIHAFQRNMKDSGAIGATQGMAGRLTLAQEHVRQEGLAPPSLFTPIALRQVPGSDAMR